MVPCLTLWLCSKNISVTDESSVTLSPSEVDLDAADVVSGVYCVYSVTDSSHRVCVGKVSALYSHILYLPKTSKVL